MQNTDWLFLRLDWPLPAMTRATGTVSPSLQKHIPVDFGRVNSVGKGPRGLDPHVASHGNDEVRLGLRKWSAAPAQGWEHTH